MIPNDREIEYEIHLAASRPLRFFDIADEFYRLSKWDPADKELWSRFFQTCKRILVEASSDGPYTLLQVNPDLSFPPTAERV